MIPELAMHLINSALVALVFGALYTDVRSRRIPNWQTVPAIGIGIALNAVYAGQAGILSSLTGGLIGAALLLLPYLLGGMGAGDVKLLMAIGALKGSPFILWTGGYAALIGGLMAIAIVIKRKSVLPLLRYLLNPLLGSGVAAYVPPALTARISLQTAERPESLSVRLPYGVAIGLGTLGALYLQYLH
ncbi:MAG: prepilin peptidase [Chloroflexi bacterium]|nr:prepilin peptidase [Chloroflexota bacterium]